MPHLIPICFYAHLFVITWSYDVDTSAVVRPSTCVSFFECFEVHIHELFNTTNMFYFYGIERTCTQKRDVDNMNSESDMFRRIKNIHPLIKKMQRRFCIITINKGSRKKIVHAAIRERGLGFLLRHRCFTCVKLLQIWRQDRDDEQDRINIRRAT